MTNSGNLFSTLPCHFQQVFLTTNTFICCYKSYSFYSKMNFPKCINTIIHIQFLNAKKKLLDLNDTLDQMENRDDTEHYIKKQ